MGSQPLSELKFATFQKFPESMKGERKREIEREYLLFKSFDNASRYSSMLRQVMPTYLELSCNDVSDATGLNEDDTSSFIVK